MTIPAWTYSQLEKFETCPRQFYHVRVKKDWVEAPTDATRWGEKVHTAMENRVLYGEALPDGMNQWESIATKIASMKGEIKCEQKMAVDSGFQPADWGSAWSRGIADVVITYKDTAVILDYKTGKRKPTEQLMLYAGYAFAHYPQVQTVTTGFVWLKEKKIDKTPFHRSDVSTIWLEFLPRVRKLETAYEKDKWLARPSGLCNGWCPVKSCEFYKDKK
jgi:predicted RecB family nuclease